MAVFPDRIFHMDRVERLTNLRNSNLITNDTYLSQLGMGNYSAALVDDFAATREYFREDGGCLLLTEEEHAFRNAKKQVFKLIESKDPINSTEFFDLIDLVVAYELKHNLKPVFEFGGTDVDSVPIEDFSQLSSEEQFIKAFPL